jgi:hypothetical protein
MANEPVTGRTLPKPRVVAVSAIAMVLVCFELESLLGRLYRMEETKEKWTKSFIDVDVVGP